MGNATFRFSSAALSIALLAGVAVLAADPTSKTDAKPKEPKDVAAAMAMLDATEFVRREAALDFLMRQPADVLPQIEDRLERARAPESIDRLTLIALHLYMKKYTPVTETTAVLGLRFSREQEPAPNHPDQMRNVFTVTDLLPGIPAAENLKVGDRIISVDDSSFGPSFNDDNFRELITAHKPGDKITLGVIRGKAKLDIEVSIVGATSILGIRFSREQEPVPNRPDRIRNVIVIAELLPGFPAAEYLKIGDRIVSIDDSGFGPNFNDDSFKDLIVAHKPGDKVTFGVVRGMSQIDVAVTIAGTSDISDLNRVRYDRTTRATRYLSSLKKAPVDELVIPATIDDETQEFFRMHDPP